MRRILYNPIVRLVCWYLVLILSGIAMAPTAVRAAFISPSELNLMGMDAPDKM